MAEAVLEDVFTGVKDFFATQLAAGPAVDVKLAFADERGQVEGDRVYPAARVDLFQIAKGDSREYSGAEFVYTDDGNGTTATKTRKPIPIDLRFQLDTFCVKRADDWNVSTKLLKLFGSNSTKFTTALNMVLYINPETITQLDGLEDGITFRKTYRFLIQVWFDSPETAETVFLVLEQRLNFNNDEYRIPAA